MQTLEARGQGRDGRAVVELVSELGQIELQLTPAEARQLAATLLCEASCAESEAELAGFFGMLRFTPTALRYMLNEFRDYRERKASE